MNHCAGALDALGVHLSDAAGAHDAHAQGAVSGDGGHRAGGGEAQGELAALAEQRHHVGGVED